MSNVPNLLTAPANQPAPAWANALKAAATPQYKSEAERVLCERLNRAFGLA